MILDLILLLEFLDGCLLKITWSHSIRIIAHLVENGLDVSLSETSIAECMDNRKEIFELHQLVEHTGSDLHWLRHCWVSLTFECDFKLVCQGTHLAML